ncbi:hypothetical protein PLEOSDRAFT_1015217, partial [Pleurotus ostreatus PC15]
FTSFVATSIVIAGLSASAYGHAAAHPALGIKEPMQRRDVRRPNAQNPCGAGVNIAQNLDTTPAIPVNADGSFSVVVENYNAGLDGSRQFTMSVDATATGSNFVQGTITKNGVRVSIAPAKETIQAQLPAGTTCTGGSTGNKCLAQFLNAASQKFGNCVVVR